MSVITRLPFILSACSLLFLSLWLCACSSDSGPTLTDGDTETAEDGDDDAQEAVLTNGLSIRQSDGGEVEFILGDRKLITLPADAGPVLRNFDESVESQFGQWKFERINEEDAATSINSAPTVADGYITLDYSGDDELLAILTVIPVNDETTRLTLSFSGTGDAIAFPLRCSSDDTFHGFGEQYNATNQRGEAFRIMVSEQGIGRDASVGGGALWWLTGDTHTSYFPMPYFINAAGGYGVLFETDYRSTVDLCATDPDVAWFEVMSDEPLSILLFHGPTPLDVIDQLGRAVGRPDAPPDWAYQTWICTQGGRDAVLQKVAALEANDIPFGALWIQDWTGPRQNIGGGFGVQYRWEHDPEHYPDLAAMVADLHAKNYHVLGYVNPFVQQELDNHYSEMDAMGLLAKQPDADETYTIESPAGTAGHPDFTNPETVDYVQGTLGRIVSSLGFDGWMADFGEYFPLDAALSDGSDPRAYHNRYPIEWTRMSRMVMKRERPDGNFVYFSRSGWTGSQDVAQIHWVGDQEADWLSFDGLPTVVPAMLNLGLSGQPYVTHDIAGFSGGPSTKELYLRWTELGAFTPFMRTHDGNNRAENWNWDKDLDTIAHFRRFAKIHDALSEDFKELAQAAQTTSAPILRHLMLEFPDDPETYNISDQYMIGDGLLVAPVTTEGATSREVYLPEGDWYNVWTGEKLAGGRRHNVSAPIGSPPVFNRGADRTDLRLID